MLSAARSLSTYPTPTAGILVPLFSSKCLVVAEDITTRGQTPGASDEVVRAEFILRIPKLCCSTVSGRYYWTLFLLLFLLFLYNTPWTAELTVASVISTQDVTPNMQWVPEPEFFARSSSESDRPQQNLSPFLSSKWLKKLPLQRLASPLLTKRQRRRSIVPQPWSLPPFNTIHY